tara:strand:+ start:8869 stop:9243 length:375 start_codon:yes stop_codon:yes gene_type:complete
MKLKFTIIFVLLVLISGCINSLNLLKDVTSDTNETIERPERPPMTHEIIIKDFKFAPNEIHIIPGDSIKWINKDFVPHQMDSLIVETNIIEKSGFETTKIDAEPGNYEYICSIHPYMKGSIIIL